MSRQTDTVLFVLVASLVLLGTGTLMYGSASGTWISLERLTEWIAPPASDAAVETRHGRSAPPAPRAASSTPPAPTERPLRGTELEDVGSGLTRHDPSAGQAWTGRLRSPAPTAIPEPDFSSTRIVRGTGGPTHRRTQPPNRVQQCMRRRMERRIERHVRFPACNNRHGPMAVAPCGRTHPEATPHDCRARRGRTTSTGWAATCARLGVTSLHWIVPGRSGR